MYQYRILTKRQHNLLENPEVFDNYKKKSKERIRARIRKRVKEAIIELTDIIKMLPESDQNLVFIDDNLREFFRLLFQYETSLPTSKTTDNEEVKKMIEKERQKMINIRKKKYLRLSNLGKTLIPILGDVGEKLEPDLISLLRDLSGQKHPLLGISAMWLSRNWRSFRKQS